MPHHVSRTVYSSHLRAFCPVSKLSLSGARRDRVGDEPSTWHLMPVLIYTCIFRTCRGLTSASQSMQVLNTSILEDYLRLLAGLCETCSVRRWLGCAAAPPVCKAVVPYATSTGICPLSWPRKGAGMFTSPLLLKMEVCPGSQYAICARMHQRWRGVCKSDTTK